MNINELSEKLDKILEKQKLILNKLENKIVLESNLKAIDNNLSKKQKEKQELGEWARNTVAEMIALKPHKRKLKEQFNLLASPHKSRVKAYLKTNDPKVFDGLRRKD